MFIIKGLIQIKILADACNNSCFILLKNNYHHYLRLIYETTTDRTIFRGKLQSKN